MSATTANTKPSVQTSHILSAMEENTNSFKALIKGLITHFDEQKINSDKQRKSASTIRYQVSARAPRFTKQIDLTQADVDETRKTLEASASPHGSVPVLVLPPLPLPRTPQANNQHRGLTRSPGLEASGPL